MKYNYEICEQEVLKYSSKSELRKQNSVLYQFILRNKWYNLIEPLSKIKGKGYWNYESCKSYSLRYKSRNELKKGCKTVYNLIMKNKWYELLSHMDFRNKKWDYESCKNVALLCKTRKELSVNYNGAYSSILRNNWSELLSHMRLIGNSYKRLIYVYEFDDKSCYVGLTYNIEKRNEQHYKSVESPIYKHIQKTNIIPNLIVKTDYIDVESAAIMEEIVLNNYKADNWNILNKRKTGGIGGTIKWDYESCKKEALKYNNKSSFCKKSIGAYTSSLKNGWLDEITKHFESSNRKPKGYWNNKELCKEESMKYTNRGEFCKKCNNAYKYSIINGWLDEFFNDVKIKK